MKDTYHARFDGPSRKDVSEAIRDVDEIHAVLREHAPHLLPFGGYVEGKIDTEREGTWKVACLGISKLKDVG